MELIDAASLGGEGCTWMALRMNEAREGEGKGDALHDDVGPK